MRTRVILVAMLFVLLALPMAVQAQEPEPEVVVSDQVTAVNEGDAVAANETMAENATVTVPAATVTDTAAPAPTEGESEDEDEDEDPAAAAEADPAATQQYSGTANTQAYFAGQTAASANTTLGECSVAGETVTCAASYTSAALQARGIDFLEGQLVVTVVEGKIQTFDFIPSAAAVTKIQTAFATPRKLPVTGGTTPATDYTLMLVAMGLLLLLAGAGTYAFQRRGA